MRTAGRSSLQCYRGLLKKNAAEPHGLRELKQRGPPMAVEDDACSFAIRDLSHPVRDVLLCCRNQVVSAVIVKGLPLRVAGRKSPMLPKPLEEADLFSERAGRIATFLVREPSRSCKIRSLVQVFRDYAIACRPTRRLDSHINRTEPLASAAACATRICRHGSGTRIAAHFIAHRHQESGAPGTHYLG